MLAYLLLTLGLWFPPYIRSRNPSYLVSKMELHQVFVCLDEIFGCFGSRNRNLWCVTSEFMLWPRLFQCDKYVSQGWQFLENCILNVGSHFKWIHVRTLLHYGDSDKRSKELFLEMRPTSPDRVWPGRRGGWVSIKPDRCPTCSHVFFSKAIMTIRTWAAWEKNLFLSYALPIFFIFVWVGGFATIGIFSQSLRCQCALFGLWLLLVFIILFFIIVEPNGRTPYIGCYVTQYDPIVFLSWCLLLIYDKGAVVDY